ncbi:signal peptidase I [Hugenholtzia roseola]|uniref:signal peptidase I n=1 Tax=Hugenholtzia roseola TaxID=1002 RepID=UPI00047BDA27|nr:signal peptidase I [Hugenholtzia roseola]
MLKFPWTKKATTPKVPKSPMREWFDSLLFAIIVATLARWLIAEPFKIPTPSMEGSLLAGDFVLVSKISYGARTPKTPLQFPLTHRDFWGLPVPSYLDWIALPQARVPSLGSIERNDAIIFNYPAQLEYPSDLRDNYIKRCVGLPGDEFEIRDKVIYINGKAQENPPNTQFQYLIIANQVLTDDTFRRNGIPVVANVDNSRSIIELNRKAALHYFPNQIDSLYTTDESYNYYVVYTTEAIVDKFAQYDFVAKVVKTFDSPLDNSIFNEPKWTLNNFGKITIPKEGMTIELTPQNVRHYGYTIQYYEGLENVEIKDETLYLNGNALKDYVFKQDYYFAMGDNRHNSLDSRYWGFVPADHIVGKGSWVWFSIDPDLAKGGIFARIRWDRVGNSIE